MWLQELIKILEQQPKDKVVPLGFSNPHSYRGYYDELAFEPEENVTVGQMLEDAQSALGNTYTGYKGGDFTMNGTTDVWLAKYGRTGEGIGPVLLKYMLGLPLRVDE